MNRMYKGLFGIEKESMRVNEMGHVSEREHPAFFGEYNPFIQRDFAEAQVEMITPPCDSIDRVVGVLGDIESVVLNNIGDDYLWNQSNPPIIKAGYSIPVAKFESDRSKVAYREYLLERYGQEKSIISGIHFNFSLDDEFIRELHTDSSLSFHEFRDQLYLKLVKYIQKDRWFFMFLTNASPVFHRSYYYSCVNLSHMKDNGDCVIEGMNSLRNSMCGYRNKEVFYLDYSSVEGYENSIREIVKQGSIVAESELYAPLRLKKDKDGHVAYIEVRFLDIYPFDSRGVNPIDLKYLHMYMVSKVMAVDFEFDDSMQKASNLLADMMALGRDFMDYNEIMHRMHNSIVDFVGKYPAPYDSEAIFKSVVDRIDNYDCSYVSRLLKAYEHSSYVDFHSKQAVENKEVVLKYPFVFLSYPGLELSTKVLLQAAIKYGYEFEVLDEASNFIELIDPQTKKRQLIMQATKTNLDGYASVLAMDNKAVSKHILSKHKIRVPKGDVLTKRVDAGAYVNRGIVIKPNATNFGDGITIFPDGACEGDIEKAFDYAFSRDSTVLVEEFIRGKEYRFLVIDHKVIGVLHRKAANVVGDGIHSVQALIDQKNKHPYRAKNYTTPLEIIEVDALVLDFLKLQDKSLEYIPEVDEVVYLRENSNISTGGDSIDVSDGVHPSYKDLALEAAKAFGVSISGIDIIIEDITKPATDDNYSILELNFNPAIHIHTYPLIGKNRYPADHLLRALFKKGAQ